MKSSFSHFVFAFIVCVIALVSCWYWYGYVAAKSVSVAMLQNQIDAKSTDANRIAAADAELAEIGQDEEQVKGYFVPQSGVVAFVSDLEARGRALGATVTVSSVSAASTGAHPTLSLALSVKGLFDPVMRTIGAIENAPYDLSIPTLSVVPDAGNAWRADMKLVVGSAP